MKFQAIFIIQLMNVEQNAFDEVDFTSIAFKLIRTSMMSTDMRNFTIKRASCALPIVKLALLNAKIATVEHNGCLIATHEKERLLVVPYKGSCLIANCEM